jgi:predicted enzyme related to lactoylglutathione lyase
MTFRYVHTNIIARDWKKVSLFYQKVFHCRTLENGSRDIEGEWIDRMTGVPSAHLKGEHLLLPGYSEDHPTLEIFSYVKAEDEILDTTEVSYEILKSIDRPGFAHLAFEVDDVRETLKEVLVEGGGQVGEVVEAVYPGNIRATFVYATDIEGNIVELQSWKKIED